MEILIGHKRNLGKKHSAATKAKMVLAQKRRREKEKEKLYGND